MTVTRPLAEVTGIDHVYITVADLAKSEAFYDQVLIEALGFRKNTFSLGGDPHIQYFNRHFGLVLRPARIHARHEPYSPGLHHLCLRVDSTAEVHAVAEHLRRAGIDATQPTLYPQYAPDYTATFFEDPDGIRLEVTNYRDERRARHDQWDQSLDLRAIALEMKAARDEARHLEPFTSRFAGFDNERAYEVSALIHRARLEEGFIPVGRKIGFTNPAMWDRYGVREPIWAHVYDRTVVFAPGSSARCSLAGFVEPKIEPEIIVHFRSAPPPGGDLAQILESVDWFAHGFEIVQSHFPGWVFRAPDAIADCSLHATLLVGEPQGVNQLAADLLRDQESFSIALSRDGELRENGRGSNVLGSPLAAIAHLLAVLAKQPHAKPLQAGELVTTGTLTAALPVRAGECWTTRLEGIALPGMRVVFEDRS